jgi:hypothetical protein
MDQHAVEQIEQVLRHDPGGRGIASSPSIGPQYRSAGVEQAAASLIRQGRRVAIVTGFCVCAGQRRLPENDGPPGALYLARALNLLGIEARLVSDSVTAPLLAAAAAWYSLPRSIVVEVDAADETPLAAWGPTHLVAIERVGPSHTETSLAAQRRAGPPPLAEFRQEVPQAEQNRCHDMHGAIVDHCNPPLYQWFETAASAQPPVVTIAVGDGGNEIGMGSIPWEGVRAAVRAPWGGRIACRVAADHLIVAGVSNWGGYALALVACALRGRLSAAGAWNCSHERAVLYQLAAAGAVDGVTQRAEPTVDGLATDIYLAALAELREALGLPP